MCNCKKTIRQEPKVITSPPPVEPEEITEEEVVEEN